MFVNKYTYGIYRPVQVSPKELGIDEAIAPLGNHVIVCDNEEFVNDVRSALAGITASAVMISPNQIEVYESCGGILKLSRRLPISPMTLFGIRDITRHYEAGIIFNFAGFDEEGKVHFDVVEKDYESSGGRLFPESAEEGWPFYD